MNIGIAGLGLIGGSLAKAYKKHGNIKIYGYDRDKSITDIAKIYGAVDEELNEQTIKECECVLIALYPEAAEEYIIKMAPFIDKNTLVMDCCGTKKRVCEIGFKQAEKYGFTFAGGHPMAGTHNSGFKSATEDLFLGACMVIVPDRFDDIDLLDRIKSYVMPAGFGRVSVTTAEKHDEIIAFTSQMAHIVSNAYVKSPTAKVHKGFSAGSYKDLTRVAWLDPNMWTELFLENKEHLIKELSFFINAMSEYKDAIENEDKDRLRSLLAYGRKCKEEVDGK